MENEINKHEMYRGKIQEFKKMIKYIDEETMKKLHDTGKLNDLAKSVKDAVESGFGIFPKVCSEDCELIDVCPFAKADAMPIGKACPIELYLLDEVSTRLQKEIMPRYKDKNIPMSVLLTITSIATLHILSNFRLKGLLSTESFKKIVTIKTNTGLTETEVMNPLINDMTTLYDSMQKLLKNLHLHPIDLARYPDKREEDAEKAVTIDQVKFMKMLENQGIKKDVIIKAYRESKEGNDDK